MSRFGFASTLIPGQMAIIAPLPAMLLAAALISASLLPCFAAPETVSLDSFLSKGGSKAGKGNVKDGKTPGPITINDTDNNCELVGHWADNKGDNPEGKGFSGGGCVGEDYHYTSSHGKYARTGGEKAIYTPSIPRAGMYKVEISWRGTSNRSSKVTYEVRHRDGRKKEVFSQRSDSCTWKTLGTFPFEAGKNGWVAMVSDGGSSASVDAARFTWVRESDGASNGDAVGDINDSGPDDSIPGGDKPSVKPGKGSGKISLNSSDTGTRDFTFASDGKASVTACLSTYGKASLTVKIVSADGTVRNWLTWKRSNDTDPAPLKVDGRAEGSSMSRVGPGDFSPNPVTLEADCRAGDRVILTLEGEFGRAEPQLEFTAR